MLQVVEYADVNLVVRAALLEELSERILDVVLVCELKCCVDACGEVKDEKGNALMKKWWEMTDKDIDTCMKATTWPYADLGYFRGGGYSSRFVTRAEMPCTMVRLNMVKGLGPFPSPGDLRKPGIEPSSLTLQANFLPAEPQRKPILP